MSDAYRTSRAAWLLAGTVLGLVISLLVPHAPLHATATERQDTFSMATGQVEDGVDAIYMLDFLTGDLTAAILNPQTRAFNSVYKRNIKEDLKVDAGKNPRFMMITGSADLRGGGGQNQFASSVLYVAELGSGNMGVYCLPFNAAQQNRAMNAVQSILALQVVPFRTTAVREQ